MFDRSRYRTKSIGVRVTEADFGRLEALADAEGRPLSEWCREVLLDRLHHRTGDEPLLLGELLALRAILLNLFYASTRGQEITGEEMQEIIARADADKLHKAWERLQRTAAGKVEASR
ncbi:MAG TPA: hypothetical protein VIX19_15475 [Terriglobales bacterium]